MFVLILPYGASFGFVSVALPYLARRQGIAVEAIGALVAAAYLPHAPKFLWAPVVDVLWSRKGWYLLALALVAAGTFAAMAAPIRSSSLPTLTAVVVVSQIGLTLMGMACQGIIGDGMRREAKPIASGWLQAGSFLGTGVGGGAALKLVERFGGPVGGAVLCAALLACAFPLLWFDEPAARERGPVFAAVRHLGRDLLELARSPGGIAALLICVSPVGSGAAANLFAAIADEWSASLRVVALTTGALGGVASAGGAACGGWVSAQMSRSTAYALGGALAAATDVAMALAPRDAWAYATLTLLYQACNGFAFAAFSALVFDMVGKTAVATKYNVFASLANLAIAFTTRADGAAHSRWGGRGLLWADAAMTLGGISVLLVVATLARRPARDRP